jgi:hypothetical protein
LAAQTSDYDIVFAGPDKAGGAIWHLDLPALRSPLRGVLTPIITAAASQLRPRGWPGAG